MFENLSLEERQERFRQLYEMYLEGHSLRAISSAVDLSHERVRQILMTCSNSHEYRKIQDVIDLRRSRTWQTKEVLNLLEAGNSCSKVATILNISLSAVKRISTKYNKQKKATTNC
jgi:transposase